MYNSFFEKENKIKDLFAECTNKDSRYEKIIELGRSAIRLDKPLRTEDKKVPGCQSTMFLHSWLEDGRVYFRAWSDALISAGLAELLIRAYNGETPEVVIKALPTFIEDLDLAASLTPNRAGGLYQIHLRMKQDALKLLMQEAKQSTR